MRAITREETPTAEATNDRSSVQLCGSFVSAADPYERAGVLIVPSTQTMVLSDGTTPPPLGQLVKAGLNRIADALSDVIPPFGYLAQGGNGSDVLAATDRLGLQHVYLAEGTGFAAVSTSSTMLARLVDSRLDERSCAVYSLIGNFLTNRTKFAGVRKLEPAETVRLVAGKVQSSVARERIPVMVRDYGWFQTQQDAVAAGRSVLEDIVQAIAEIQPEALLELSGGLDSRVLAAVGRSCGYRSMRTMTIGMPDDTDVTLAQRIVANSELSGAVVPVSLLDEIDPSDVLRLVRRAANQRDFAADPVSGALYDAVEAEVPAPAQVSGIGGELARGNYYTGQRTRAHFDQDMIERIMQWRLVSNWNAAPALFDVEFRRNAESWLREDSWSYVSDLDVPWPLATDELYLFARLQPWGGSVFSRRGADRQILAPLYHPRFIEWASRIPIALKRNSRAFSAVLHDVAPDLAALPLDTGVTPFQLADRSLRSRGVVLATSGRRVRQKVQRRISRRGKTPVGTARLSAAILTAWRAEPPDALSSIPWLDQEALEQVVAGRRELTTPSIAFLMNLDSALQHVNA